MSKVKVIIIRTAGTNCNEETAFAFEYFGAQVDQVHVNELIQGSVQLKDYHILALPGGFSYGDDIASGKVLANELVVKLGAEIEKFVKAKKLVIGICNGFQILVKAGILPGPFSSKDKQQTVTLTHNDSGLFEDRWVHLKVSGKSPWIKNLSDQIFIPVAHAEGKFVVKSQAVLKQLKDKDQIAFQYVNEKGSEPVYPENPNGAVEDIAGITDQTGRVLGLMPHPERHFLFTHHPFWTRLPKQKLGEGAKIFENGVKYIKQEFL